MGASSGVLGPIPISGPIALPHLPVLVGLPHKKGPEQDSAQKVSKPDSPSTYHCASCWTPLSLAITGKLSTGSTSDFKSPPPIMPFRRDHRSHLARERRHVHGMSPAAPSESQVTAKYTLSRIQRALSPSDTSKVEISHRKRHS